MKERIGYLIIIICLLISMLAFAHRTQELEKGKGKSTIITKTITPNCPSDYLNAQKSCNGKLATYEDKLAGVQFTCK